MLGSGYDFGYSWPWTRGHLIVLAVFGPLALVAWRRGWRRWITLGAGVVALWGLVGSLVVHQVLLFNKPIAMPTPAFLPSGSGRVLDLGAGSGRSTLMVLLARPQATVTAFDLYGRDYYGIDDNTPARLMANARVAGVASRVDVTVGDMRDLPFEPATFDAAVSAFAIDHLSADGVRTTLGEAARVLKPRGQFLLLVLHVDGWIRVAFPSLHGHGYFAHSPAPERWRSALAGAGFEIVAEGRQPGTLYVLGEKRSAPADVGAK